MVFILALAAFEAFNFSTTDFALSDLLGELRFAGIRWAMLLALAFCGIDFAGIARLLAPQSDQDDNLSLWFMFSAWILAATMNAILTWWGVVLAIQMHPVMSAGVLNSGFVTRVIPIMIALMVWMIRILLVGVISKKGERNSSVRKGSPATPTASRREFRQAQSKAAHAGTTVSMGINQAAEKAPVSTRRGNKPQPQYVPIQNEPAYRSLNAGGSAQRQA